MSACFKNQIFAEPKMKFILSLLFLLALILLIQAMPRYILVPINEATPIYWYDREVSLAIKCVNISL